MMSDDAPPPQPAASSGLAEESTGQHLANAVNAQFKLHANVDDLAGATPNDPARATLARRPEQYGVLKQRMMDACDSAIDGAFVNMWILFSINHYDLRQERVLVLTEKSVLRIKLDFYAVKVQRVTRMLLSEIESVTFGPFQYEEGSMSAQVAEKGKASLAGVDAAQGTEALKIQLKQAAPPSFLDKWNPIASKIGETVTVVTSHLRAGESDTAIDDMESVKHFIRALVGALQGRIEAKRAPILSECSPVGLVMAMAHNQSAVGEWRTRFVMNSKEVNM